MILEAHNEARNNGTEAKATSTKVVVRNGNNERDTMGEASRDHTANEDKMTQLETIPINGIIYNDANGSEIGSITIRPTNYIAFIAGNWCKQVHRSQASKLLEIAQEHKKRMFKLLSKL